MLKESIILSLLFVIGCSSPAKIEQIAAEPKIEVRFSPHGGCADMIVREINKSKNSIWVQAYSFTSAKIGEALVNAKTKGVNVQVILDKSNENDPNSLIHLMMENNIPVYLDRSHKIAHSKIMILDDRDVLSGSFNFSKSADEANSENCIHITDRNTTISYQNDWIKHKEHSKEY